MLRDPLLEPGRERGGSLAGLRDVCRLGSAPFCRSTFTSLCKPFWDAMWMGVSPNAFLWLGTAPWWTRKMEAASFFSMAARWRRELPVRVSTESVLAPLSISRAANV